MLVLLNYGGTSDPEKRWDIELQLKCWNLCCSDRLNQSQWFLGGITRVPSLKRQGAMGALSFELMVY